MSAKKIVFYSPKGGVGKSTGVMNVAGILAAKYRKNVLIIDADPSANVTSGFAAEASAAKIAYPDFLSEMIKRNFIGKVPLKAPTAAIVPAFPKVNSYESAEKQEARRRIFIAPAIAGGTSASPLIRAEDEIMKHNYALETQGKKRDYMHLARFFAPLEKHFDYFLIDAPGAIAGAMYQEAVCAADYVVSPAEADRWSPSALHRIRDVVNAAAAISGRKVSFLGYYLSKFDARRTRTDVAVREASNDSLLFSTAIPYSSVIKNAQFETDILAFSHPSDSTTKCFEQLTDEIVVRIKKFEKRRRNDGK